MFTMSDEAMVRAVNDIRWAKFCRMVDGVVDGGGDNEEKVRSNYMRDGVDEMTPCIKALTASHFPAREACRVVQEEGIERGGD